MTVSALRDSEASSFDQEKYLGDVIAGTYRITRQIGAGGSGQVFEAEHVRLGRSFAVKLLRPHTHGKKAAQRFRREAQAISRIDSPHVVGVVDCGELPDRTPYLVMELLQGEDLRALLERHGHLPLHRAIRIIVEACHGLSAVHAAGLVHRDVKPENMFITRRPGGEDWCKLLDFGVAKMDSTLSTAEDAILGTARYMAPEQIAASAEVEPTADVYALGAVLYECLSGRPVHAAKTVHQVMYQAMNQEPAALATLCPVVPKSITNIVHRCLSKQPTQRPRSTAELARQLEAALSENDIDPAARTLSENVVLHRTSSPTQLGWRIPTLLVGTACLLVGWWLGNQQATSVVQVSTKPAATVAAIIRAQAQPPTLPVSSPPAPTMAAPLPPPSARPRKLALSSTPVTPLRVGDIDIANPYGK